MHIPFEPCAGQDSEEAEGEFSSLKAKYEKLAEFKCVVMQDQPWLGASPDGLSVGNGEDIALEIKCPYSTRDSTDLDMGYIDHETGDLKTHQRVEGF